MNKLGAALFLVTLILTFTGLFVLYESSSYTALLHIGDKYYFIKNQSLWIIMGIVLALIISKINYKFYKKLSLPFLLGTFVLLIAVFIPGIGLQLKGAHRWINLGFTVLQPSELLKISFTLYLAAWLSSSEKKKLLSFLGLLGFCLGLVIIEPDLGTATIIGATSILVYFYSGARIREFAAIVFIFLIAVFLLIIVAPYRAARLAAFVNFDSGDLSTTSYHVKQILISVGSGGLTGVGIGNSVQKYAYLPENTTDSIFAIYAEETGLIGSLLLLVIYFLQLMIGFLISLHSKDVFGRLLALGIISFIGIQAVINISSQVVLFPLTGVPLPFISYGGSAMVINFVSIGILMSIAKYSISKHER